KIKPELSSKEEGYRKADQKFVFTSDKQNKAVLAYRFSDKFEIVDYGTGDSQIVKGLEGFESNFTPIKNEADKYDMVENKETRRAFTEGYVSDAFIYLAFSGKKSIDPESYKTDIILKYDWNGTPV